MQNQWSDNAVFNSLRDVNVSVNSDIAFSLYGSRLLGQEPALVLHGGGNSSVKSTHTDLLGREIAAIYVKASGHDMANLTTDGMPGMRLAPLQELRSLRKLDDAAMVNELRANLLDASAPTPSIEALLHAFIPENFIYHSHADAILTLSNQKNGERKLRRILGIEVIILPYIHPGFLLAKAAAEAFAARPNARGMVLMQHGLITWGEEAKTAYDTHIELVTKVEEFIKGELKPEIGRTTSDDATARARYRAIAPVLRGAMATPSGDPDRPHRRFILQPLLDGATRSIIDSPEGRTLLATPPLTSDHLIRTKPFAAWIGDADNPAPSLDGYRKDYLAYFKRHADADQTPYDTAPRVVCVPGIGIVCAGRDAKQAEIARDITRQTIQVKTDIAAMGGEYNGISEAAMFSMEYYELQQAKLKHPLPTLEGSVAVITGAAGAIGAGVCRELLANGCHVAATDLAGDPLNSLAAELERQYPGRVIAVPMDVSDPEAVAQAFGTIIDTWGGLDTVIINAGLAHVSSLADMEQEAFKRLQRVNTEGTLNLLSESGRLLKKQGTGGDIILISTKNVFAPGANFGAYSATKAAAHQLARIASLEMAPMDVRVNMVAPDAVFSEGSRKSGLWAEVGPDRMKARGLDEAGLEAYYQNRNLLKAAVTAKHVANAVLYFVTRQSPTTGATLPVDGGPPDATPR